MCLYPRTVWKTTDLETGLIKLSFKPVPVEYILDVFQVPCGKCLECVKQYSTEWSFRIMDEASKYDKSCCVTLTYNDEHLPSDLCVNKRDYQLFLKLLRKRLGKLRYFGCAEYGGKRYRPHYHIILFGVDFDDKYFWCKSKSDGDLFRSSILETCWPNGYSYIGKLDLSTAKYCAKYLQKFAFNNIPELKNRTPSFTFMSTHPGIGGDFRPCLSTDKLYKVGKYVKTPRYYLKQAERQGFDISRLKSNRRLKCDIFYRDYSQLKKLRRKSKKLLT